MGRHKLTAEQLRAAIHADFLGTDCTLAIHESHVEAILRGQVSPRAGWDNDDDCPLYSRVGSIAVVSIRGSLGQRGGVWWDGHESVRAKIEKALLDPSVGAVVLDISSPGGVVAGCWDAVRAVQAAKIRSGKPILGYAHEHAYSAAYAWAMVADELYLPESGGTGSIGVLSILYDQSKMWDELGIKFAVVRSGERKARGNGYEPLDQATVDESQSRVDLLAGQFFALVAAQRRIKVDALRALEGACFDGAIAVEKKLADGILSWDAFLNKAELAGRKHRMRNTAKMLGLSEDASESQINAAIEALQVKANDFNAAASKLAEIATIHALETGRIKAGEVDAQKALIAKQPVEGANALMARERMSAIPQPTTGEKKADNAGAPPATPNVWAAHEAMSDPQLGVWYSQIMTDAQLVMEVAKQNPKLFARAENAYKVSR